MIRLKANIKVEKHEYNAEYPVHVGPMQNGYLKKTSQNLSMCMTRTNLSQQAQFLVGIFKWFEAVKQTHGHLPHVK